MSAETDWEAAAAATGRPFRWWVVCGRGGFAIFHENLNHFLEYDLTPEEVEAFTLRADRHLDFGPRAPGVASNHAMGDFEARQYTHWRCLPPDSVTGPCRHMVG